MYQMRLQHHSKASSQAIFSSDYLMPAQSTRARKLALENKSCATAQPLNTARVGERTQAASLQPRRLLGCTATPHSSSAGLRNSVEEETARFKPSYRSLLCSDHPHHHQLFPSESTHIQISNHYKSVFTGTWYIH